MKSAIQIDIYLLNLKLWWKTHWKMSALLKGMYKWLNVQLINSETQRKSHLLLPPAIPSVLLTKNNVKTVDWTTSLFLNTCITMKLDIIWNWCTHSLTDCWRRCIVHGSHVYTPLKWWSTIYKTDKRHCI